MSGAMNGKHVEKPRPPRSRLRCDFCGDITYTGKHTHWMCRLVGYSTRTYCRVFGHKIVRTEPERGVASGWYCERCNHIEPGIVWPRPKGKK